MTDQWQRVVAAALAGAALTLAFASGSALAQTAQQAIQYRKASMQVQSWHARTLVQMLKGARPFDAAVYLRSATALDAMAATTFEGFTAGSDTGETRASPAIWKDPAGFKAAIDQFQGATAKAVAVAKTGDEKAMRNQVTEIVRSCDGCHEKFRTK
jgi:cytochrome c556